MIAINEYKSLRVLGVIGGEGVIKSIPLQILSLLPSKHPLFLHTAVAQSEDTTDHNCAQHQDEHGGTTNHCIGSGLPILTERKRKLTQYML